MNDLENYEEVLEQFFGTGTATFDTTTGAKNNAIGALNRADFAPFRSEFLKRLKRLAARYANEDASRKHLVDTLNEVASERNWEGAYAEVVAFDFLNSDEDWLSKPINLSKTVPAADTLADGLGNQNANFDGFYEDFGVSFDVKVLSDKSRSILDGIIEEAKASPGVSGASIEPEYPLDLDYELFQRNRNGLVAELEHSIDPQAQTALVRSEIVPNLTYRLKWHGGVLTTVGTYDPFLHAANHHKLLFNHAKKFSRTQPSLIVFVVFPWFSEKVTNQNKNNDIFYRSFCRRFFCQYTRDDKPGNTVLKNFRGVETVAQVTEKLAGVLFLEDRSVTWSGPEAQNVEAFAYLNPNAAHKVGRHYREHLSNLRCFVDDFAHDNY